MPPAGLPTIMVLLQGVQYFMSPYHPIVHNNVINIVILYQSYRLIAAENNVETSPSDRTGQPNESWCWRPGLAVGQHHKLTKLTNPFLADLGPTLWKNL